MKEKIVCFLILGIIALVNTKVNAQSLFTRKFARSSIFTNAGVGFGEGFVGPVLGVGYSFNSKTDVALVYSSLERGHTLSRGLSLAWSFFAAKQYSCALMNIEASPAITRNFIVSDDHTSYQTFLSIGIGLSRNLSTVSDFYFIPRASFSYGISDVKRDRSLTNTHGAITSIGIDFNVGIAVGNQLFMTINPGVATSIKEKVVNGSVSIGMFLRN